MNSETTLENTWGVIFDMDGVLINSYQAHLSAWQQMLRSHDLEISETQFSATFGRANPDIFALFYPDLNPKDYARLSEEKEAAFREIKSVDFPEMDGVAELIESLHHAGAILAIGSSGPPENIKKVLQMLPCSEYFKATTNAAEITRGKPDSEVFLNAADKIGLAPTACVVVEDAPAGVQAGKAAGCAVIGITGTVSHGHLKDADLVVESLRNLSPAIFIDLTQSNVGAKNKAPQPIKTSHG